MTGGLDLSSILNPKS